ncbi:hypothetical protein WKH56_08320 [Priestia sp. SB1]|uniref:hypothetical protein n=1 Tax=Priestia sp. SB1 TaxID=3132359 RepID=UPI001DA8FAF8|nr:hypothetical protein [Priestia megaterium]
MENLFTLGLIIVASLGTIGHYVLESIKVKNGNIGRYQGYSGGLLVPKEELNSFLGIRKKDLQDFLDQFEKQLTIHTFNGREYYSADNIREVINANK